MLKGIYDRLHCSLHKSICAYVCMSTHTLMYTFFPDLELIYVHVGLCNWSVHIRIPCELRHNKSDPDLWLQHL